MDAKVDWLSFSVIISDAIPAHGWQWPDIQYFLSERVHIPFGAWEEGRGRAPYNHSATQPRNGIYVLWSGRYTHFTVEFTGVGCQHLRDIGALNEVLTDHQHRATRLDIASDFETDVQPHDFAIQRNLDRFKTHAFHHSKTGETEYVGSRTSELMARVYRYSIPHPRHGLLRVEHETKRKTAKASVRFMLENGVGQLQRELGARFGWSHSLWDSSETNLSSLSIPSQTREEAKTDIWLRTQCAPAFRRLLQSGAIKDAQAYFNEVFGNETLSQ